VSRYLNPPAHDVRDAVARALAEDLTPLGDLSATLLPPGVSAAASFVSRASGVIAGVDCATETFAQVDASLTVDWTVAEGDGVEPMQTIGKVSGSLESILVAERTALNFLMYLSGIATNTRAFVSAATGSANVWDTRKTTPGLRSLEKAAVRAGGARNHRGNLSDWIMLKDNHLLGLSIADGVARSRDRWPGRTVHVEADRLEQVEAAVAAGADAILLDNMTPDELRIAVARVEALVGVARRPLLEASGGIALDTIGEVSTTGVDMISTSKLSFGAPTLDIGLDITPDEVNS
jgi:nicotinate-nucleotide pyrophosphorylase (carboxylating)